MGINGCCVLPVINNCVVAEYIMRPIVGGNAMAIALKVIILNKHSIVCSQPNARCIIPVSYDLDSITAPWPRVGNKCILVDYAPSSEVHHCIPNVYTSMTKVAKSGMVDKEILTRVS
jgi:hypothetical protein